MKKSMPANHGTKVAIMRMAVMWMMIFVAGLLALTSLPAAFATPVAEPDLLKNQAHQTTTLFTTKSIKRNANSCPIAVYNGNVYTIYARQGDERMMVAKIPFAGSAVVIQPLVGGTDPKARGYTASDNNHKTWQIAVDRAGYIHVSGDMHTRMDMGYWRSDKPEDVSSFTQIMWEDKPPGTPLRCPISRGTTFPHFWKDRKGQLFWSAQQSSSFLPFCSYDETTKLWTSLGGPKPSKGGEICLAWTHAGAHDISNEKSKFSASSFAPVWDSHNRLHMMIGMLDKDTHGPHPRGVGTDILYVYSDDGGKTVHRADGTLVQYPIRASSGPKANQGDIILEEMSDPNNNWLNRNAGISLDKADRPTIAVRSYTTGQHYFRLEDGHWIEHRDFDSNSVGSADPSGVETDEDEDTDALTRFSNPKSRNRDTMDLQMHGYDRAYYRDTGELVWTSLKGSATSAIYTIYRTVFKPVSK